MKLFAVLHIYDDDESQVFSFKTFDQAKDCVNKMIGDTFLALMDASKTEGKEFITGWVEKIEIISSKENYFFVRDDCLGESYEIVEQEIPWIEDSTE